MFKTAKRQTNIYYIYIYIDEWTNLTCIIFNILWCSLWDLVHSSLTWPRQQLHHGSGNSFASALPTWPKTPYTLNIMTQIRIFEEMSPLLEQRLKCPVVSICLSELQFEIIRRENVQCPREHAHLKQLHYHFRVSTGGLGRWLRG